jgi:pyruvate,orthophosphate dikinase
MRSGILPENPFAAIDREGVGQLMAMAIDKARSVKPDLECGICGEHAGDPESIAFCHAIGLTYISCSQYRVPVARLAAAHAALLDQNQETQTGGKNKIAPVADTIGKTDGTVSRQQPTSFI